MRKKKAGKLSRRHSKNRSYSIFSYRSFWTISLGILIVILVGKGISSLQGSPVLSAATFLAKEDDSGSSGSSGSDSSGSGSSGSDSSGSDSSGSSSSDDNSGSSGDDSSGSSGSSASPTKTETRDDTTGIRTQTETKPDEVRTEVRLSEEEKIRTRTKDGRKRIDITAGGVKTRLEIRDDRIVIKAEQEDGTETELEDDTIFKIEERLGADGIKVGTAGAEKFVIERNSVGAVTDFPLTIDLATNTLIVNTPAGQKAVTVLPDQAVQNLIAANIVNRLGGQAIVDEVLNNNLASLSQVITLGERNGVPIYEINGISDQRLLGLIPVSIEKTLTVSAETGQVVSTQESLTNRVLDAISL